MKNSLKFKLAIFILSSILANLAFATCTPPNKAEVNHCHKIKKKYKCNHAYVQSKDPNKIHVCQWKKFPGLGHFCNAKIEPCLMTPKK